VATPIHPQYSSTETWGLAGLLPTPVVPPAGRRTDSREAAHDQPATANEATLDVLESLAGALATDPDYVGESIDFQVPEGFRLSVVVPVFNERDTITRLLARVYSLPLPLEIIVVDDHSTDGTDEILRPFTRLSEFRCVFKQENEGKGAALRSGFQIATGDIVIVQDADLEYDPRDIPRVIRPILDGQADVVYGSRFVANTARGSSAVHQLGNRLLTLASNWTTGLPLTDMETCYKAFRRQALHAVPLRQNRFGFEPEFTAKVARRGLRVQEVPIRYMAREWQAGKKIGWKDAVNALYCIARYAILD